MFSIESGPRTWNHLETEGRGIREEEDTDLAASEVRAAATGPMAKMASQVLEGPGLAPKLTKFPLRILHSALGRVESVMTMEGAEEEGSSLTVRGPTYRARASKSEKGMVAAALGGMVLYQATVVPSYSTLYPKNSDQDAFF